MDKHGWERFGENNSDTVLGGYIEGAWMTKHDILTICNMLRLEQNLMCTEMGYIQVIIR